MKRLLILGAGTAGTMVANKLRRRLSDREWAIDLVDQDEQHHYQPGRPVHTLWHLRAVDGGQAEKEVPSLIAVRAPEGDYRDWEEIEAWANEIAESLPDVTAGR